MTLEELIEQAHANGFRVLNLCELPAGGWQANLHDGEAGFDFGLGASPQEALARALLAAQQGQGREALRASQVRTAPEEPGARLTTTKSAEDLGL